MSGATTAASMVTALPDSVRKLAIEKTYPARKIIHYQDEVFENIYFIQSGRAFALSVDIDGKENWVCEYEGGQFIGCANLFNEQGSPYQIVAQTPLKCLLFKRNSFLKLIDSHESFNHQVLRDISLQLEKIIHAQITASQLSMRGQIISELSRLSRPVGKDPNTYIIRPTPIFSELAKRLGTSRETVSRTVSQLVKKGILVRTTGALIVPNPQALARHNLI